MKLVWLTSLLVTVFLMHTSSIGPGSDGLASAIKTTRKTTLKPTTNAIPKKTSSSRKTPITKPTAKPSTTKTNQKTKTTSTTKKILTKTTTPGIFISYWTKVWTSYFDISFTPAPWTSRGAKTTTTTRNRQPIPSGQTTRPTRTSPGRKTTMTTEYWDFTSLASYD